MRLKKALGSGLAAGAIGISALLVGAPGAHAATAAQCGGEPSAANFPKAGGGIDVAAYAAAVAAFNACVAGGTTTATTTTAPAHTVAFTGSNSSELGAIGAAMIGVGAGAVVLARRRRHAPAGGETKS
jgi:LPXTG-motif cell wall-anchored protein